MNWGDFLKMVAGGIGILIFAGLLLSHGGTVTTLANDTEHFLVDWTKVLQYR